MLDIRGFNAAASAPMDVDRPLPMLWPMQANAILDTRLMGNGIAKVAASAGLAKSSIKVPVRCGMKTMAAWMRME